MAVEIVKCMLQELYDTKKANSDYLVHADGKFSSCNTTDEEHYACLGKMATNNPGGSQFASLTHQLQSFCH